MRVSSLYNKQTGIILISTLGLLLMLQLLIVSQMQQFSLYLRALRRNPQAQFQDLRQLALQLAASSSKKSCILTEEQWLEKSPWNPANMHCALTFKSQTYAYTLQDLGTFPCLQHRVSHQLFSTQHQRFMLWTRKNHVLYWVIVRTAKRSPFIACEPPEIVRNTPLGILSLSYYQQEE
ncbi:MAG: hypothetical protein Q8R79_08985 [Legionellaceae bacterium]|nr:hypothetical protein [Legionellaceae bacterium]